MKRKAPSSLRSSGSREQKISANSDLDNVINFAVASYDEGMSPQTDPTVDAGFIFTTDALPLRIEDGSTVELDGLQLNVLRDKDELVLTRIIANTDRRERLQQRLREHIAQSTRLETAIEAMGHRQNELMRQCEKGDNTMEDASQLVNLCAEKGSLKRQLLALKNLKSIQIHTTTTEHFISIRMPPGVLMDLAPLNFYGCSLVSP